MYFSHKILKNSVGFTLPIVALFVLAFIAAPLVFWTVKSKPQVEGASAIKGDTKKGLYVQVSSLDVSWDLNEYLCKAEEECSKTLTSGHKWEAISGGPSTGNTIKIQNGPELEEYTWLKIFIKPGWNMSDKKFQLTNSTSIAGTALVYKEIQNTYVVLVPVSEIQSGVYHFLTFSDAK